MPYRPKKPCGKHGCSSLTDQRYCSEHSIEAKQHDRYRGSAHSRGYDGDWKRVRLLALKRDLFLCQECKRQGRLTPASPVDHIIPIRQRPDLRLEITNLQSLCKNCHDMKTVAEDGGLGRARLESSQLPACRR